MENKDGSFCVQSSPESEKEQFRNLPGKKIRAYELKTFLKVTREHRPGIRGNLIKSTVIL